MAVNFLNLFVVADTKSLVLHALSLETALLPTFFQGESPPVAFTLLTRNPGAGSVALLQPWSKISPANYSLKLGLFLTADGTQLAFQDTFVDDVTTFSKSAIFTYNSAAITTALAGGTSIACTFEVEIKDASGNPYKALQQQVTLQKQFITPTAATVPATEVAATQAWVNGNFAKRYRQQGEFDIWITPGGTAVMVTLGDDLQWNFTPLAAAP
jgi:hypothetical protein